MAYDDNLLQPAKHYSATLKQKISDLANGHFDKIIEKGQIDVEANRETVKKYNNASEELKKEQKKLSKIKVGKGFAIFGTIVFLLIGLVLIVSGALDELDPAIAFGAGIPAFLIGIGLILVICLVINKKQKAQQAVVDKCAAEVEKLYAEAKAQVEPIWSLFDYSTAYELFEEAVDIVKFDKVFDKKKLRYLVEKCDYVEDTDVHHSTVYVKSGEILGNPFMLKRTKYQSWHDVAYHGSRVVTYTETYRDSEGHLRTRTVTETLHATTYHPAPFYGGYTDLIYGNQAAPDLSFSRSPTGHKIDLKDKERDKFLRKKATELQKMSEKSMKSGQYFTPLANTEFEVYFGAFDRDHEQQFRLLFTPLAQNNYMDLFKSEEGYRDDFSFKKMRRTNYIASAHAQSVSLVCEAEMFMSHSIDIARESFVSYIKEFFRGLFFDFAPLLNIPLYQQLKTEEYIYETELESNNTMYEAEMVSNRFDPANFVNPLTITDNILKAHFVEKDGASDKVVIRAHSFEGQQRYDIVPVRAGNGIYYDVTVPWTEYLPLEQDNVVQVKHLDTDRPTYLSKMYDSNNKFSQYAQNALGAHQYFDKIFAFKDNAYFNENDDKKFDDMFKD